MCCSEWQLCGTMERSPLDAIMQKVHELYSIVRLSHVQTVVQCWHRVHEVVTYLFSLNRSFRIMIFLEFAKFSHTRCSEVLAKT